MRRMSGQATAVLRLRHPLCRAVAKIHRGDLGCHHVAREEVALHEVAERRSDAVLARGHDRGVWNRDAQRMTEQRRHGKPVGDASHHGGFGEGTHKAEPRIPGFEPARDREQQRHAHQHQRGDALHPNQPNALEFVVRCDLQRRRQCRRHRVRCGDRVDRHAVSGRR